MAYREAEKMAAKSLRQSIKKEAKNKKKNIVLDKPKDGMQVRGLRASHLIADDFSKPQEEE